MTLIRTLHGGRGTRTRLHPFTFSVWNRTPNIRGPCQTVPRPRPRTGTTTPRHLSSTSSSQLHSLCICAFSSNPSTSGPVNCSGVRIKKSTSGRSRRLLAVMTSVVQTRLHTGHSHSHSHHHDNTYLTSSNKTDAGVRITRIGLYVNLVMAVGKGIGGYYFNSQALVADAFHALTDLVSDFMTLGTVSWSLKPPTPRFPRGYGKIESLGSLGVSSLLLAGGVLMGLNACEILYHQLFADVAAHSHSHGMPFGHSHSHNPADLGPNINAAWLAAGSIIVKEYLYRATMKIALERKSSVLASNAIHHRIDSLTSIVALVAIGGSHIFTGTTWLDPVGGLIVSLMIIKAGWGNTGSALLELADVGVDDEIRTSVRKAATKALDNVNLDADVKDGVVVPRIRDVQGVKAGQNFLIDVELVVPGSWTIQEARRTEDLVRERVGSTVRGVRRVKVRFVPETNEEPNFADEFIEANVNPQSEPEKEANQDPGQGYNHHDDPPSDGIRKRY